MLKRYMPEINEETIEPLIIKHRGNLAAIGRALKVNRTTILNRVKESPQLQQALLESRETIRDDLETCIYDKALSGDTILLIFLAKTQMWQRGYSERKQIEIDVREIDGHDQDHDRMTVDRWKADQQQRITAVDATLALFEGDDDDDDTIDGSLVETG